MIRAKYAVFAVIAVVTGYVLYHNERFLIEPDHPLWEHYVVLEIEEEVRIEAAGTVDRFPAHQHERARERRYAEDVARRLHVDQVAHLVALETPAKRNAEHARDETAQEASTSC